MNIAAKLEAWQQAGLIKGEQKKAILDYEKKAGRPLFLYSLLFLSIFCIGLGIIALISANWQEIPDSVKLAGDFLLLLGVGGCIYRSLKNEKPFAAEALLFLYALLVLASIGLIGQIFQLPSSGLHAVLFWSLIVSPLLLLSLRLLLPLVWLPSFVISLFSTLYEIKGIAYYADYLTNAYPMLLEFTLLFVFVLLYKLLVYFLNPRIPQINRALGLWIAVAMVAYVVMWDLASFQIIRSPFMTSKTAVLGVWLAAGVAAGGLYAFCRRLRLPVLSVEALGMFVVFAILFNLLPRSETVFELMGAFFSLSMLGFVGVYAYRCGSVRLANWAAALMALRFFIVYLQVFGSLLATGAGLISSGVVFLVVAFVWKNVRRSLIAHMKGAE